MIYSAWSQINMQSIDEFAIYEQFSLAVVENYV